MTSSAPRRAPRPADLLVGPGLVLTPQALLRDAGVRVTAGAIAAVGPFADIQREAPAQIPHLDARGGLILPGAIDAHTTSTRARRGMPAAEPRAGDFPQILDRIWWRIDRALTGDDVETSARLGLVECVRCGVTTIVDHHASPNACAGSLDRIREAVEAVGVRASLCYEVSDRNGAAGGRGRGSPRTSGSSARCASGPPRGSPRASGCTRSSRCRMRRSRGACGGARGADRPAPASGRGPHRRRPRPGAPRRATGATTPPSRRAEPTHGRGPLRARDRRRDRAAGGERDVRRPQPRVEPEQRGRRVSRAGLAGARGARGARLRRHERGSLRRRAGGVRCCIVT